VSIYSKLARPVLFRLDPESAHHFAFSVGKVIQSARASSLLSAKKPGPELKQEFFGHSFHSPVGLAAGFDKSAEILPLISKLGFGFAEAGSVTNLPSEGNPRPRLFRLPEDRALINRLGLNNPGAEAFLENLERFNDNSCELFPVGINVAKTHSPDIIGQRGIEDVVSCFEKVQPKADFIVLNISCPNTAEGKTFEDRDTLSQLFNTLSKIRDSTPLLIKFSPDTKLSELEKLVEICETHNTSGYVLSNTSQTREGLQTSSSQLEKIGKGGLSGEPLFNLSIQRVRQVYKQVNGRKPVIGLGGIDSSSKAWSYLEAGASLLELYSGLVYEGPWLVDRINRELAERLKLEGFSSISEVTGSGV